MSKISMVVVISLLAADGLSAQRASTLVEVSRFGSADGPNALTHISTILQGPDGYLYVGQPREGHVKVFSLDGSIRTVMGRRGAGPGEYRGIDRLGWHHDSLTIHDASLQRLTIVSTRDGGFRTIGPVAQSQTRPWRAAAPVGLLLDGSAVVLPLGHQNREAEPTTTPLMRFDRTLRKRMSDLAELRGSRNYRIRIGDAGIATGRHPIAWGTLWAIHPWGSGLVVLEQDEVVQDRRGEFRLRSVKGDGSVLPERVFRYKANSVSSETGDSIVESITANWQEKLRVLGRPSDRSTLRSSVERAITIPEYWPVSDMVLHGTDGSIWFSRQGSKLDTQVWEIIAPDGSLRGLLRVPSSVTVHSVSMRTVIASSLQDYDIPVIIHYELRQ